MELAVTLLTFVHVAISLAGIASGLVVAAGLLRARRLDRWTAWFLWSTVATSVTGYLFPFNGFLPSHGVGIVSLLVLPLAIYARYRGRLAGPWRGAYVVTAMIALYLNVFVLVVQMFQKTPVLRELAPTQSAPGFLASQLVVLLLFVTLTIAAVVRFRPGGSGEMELRMDGGMAQV